MIDPMSVKGVGASDDAVDLAAFAYEKIGKIGAVLTCDTCYECFGHLRAQYRL